MQSTKNIQSKQNQQLTSKTGFLIIPNSKIIRSNVASQLLFLLNNMV